jgi:hypothetical protein
MTQLSNDSEVSLIPLSHGSAVFGDLKREDLGKFFAVCENISEENKWSSAKCWIKKTDFNNLMRLSP